MTINTKTHPPSLAEIYKKTADILIDGELILEKLETVRGYIILIAKQGNYQLWFVAIYNRTEQCFDGTLCLEHKPTGGQPTKEYYWIPVPYQKTGQSKEFIRLVLVLDTTCPAILPLWKGE